MKKKHSGPQIVAKLRQADILIGQGKTKPLASHFFLVENPATIKITLVKRAELRAQSMLERKKINGKIIMTGAETAS